MATGAILVHSPALAKGKRLRPPPNVTLRPDRGMTFGRFPKIEQDQSLLRSVNQGTRMRTVDPAIDPYKSPIPSTVYRPDSGEIRGGLVDAHRELSRAQDALHRRKQARPRTSTALAKTSAEESSRNGKSGAPERPRPSSDD